MSREKWESTHKHFLSQYEYAIEFNKQTDLETEEAFSDEYLDRRRGILWASSRLAKMEKVAEENKRIRCFLTGQIFDELQKALRELEEK